MYFRHLVFGKIYFVYILFISVINDLFLRLNIWVLADTLVLPMIYKYPIVDYGIIELLV